jgi:transposase
MFWDMKPPVLQVTAGERATLAARLRARTLRVEDVRRARVILLLAEGQSYTTIQAAVGCDARYVSRWRQRFLDAGLAGLYSRHRGRAVQRRTPQLEARILALTQQPPSDGATHWSTRKLAQRLGVSHMMVARIWQRARLQPHRVERYVASDDPDFETKAADVIGLYVHPPQHAAIFCVDEKTAIQALDRTDPVLPLSPGRAERHGFEYVRHGTLSLYAALNTKTGRVYGQTVPRHTSEAFVAFLAGLLAQQPRRQEIHIIADNLSAHKTRPPPGPPPLHADLCVLAQPSRTVVCEDRARRDRPGHLHLRARSRPQDPALHPRGQSTSATDPLDLHESGAPHAGHWQFNCYSPLVVAVALQSSRVCNAGDWDFGPVLATRSAGRGDG